MSDGDAAPNDRHRDSSRANSGRRSANVAELARTAIAAAIRQVARSARARRRNQHPALRRCASSARSMAMARQGRADQRALVSGAGRGRRRLRLATLRSPSRRPRGEAEEEGKSCARSCRPSRGAWLSASRSAMIIEATPRQRQWKRLERDILGALGIADPYAAASRRNCRMSLNGDNDNGGDKSAAQAQPVRAAARAVRPRRRLDPRRRSGGARGYYGGARLLAARTGDAEECPVAA